ncbi:MAG: hypothetical protein Q7U28_06655 [Aquabacterium sp.]|nr:hypothetical protein [Aquabacterium sp.]
MLRLCGALRSRNTGATIVILADEALRAQAPDFAVSSTKLVELRKLNDFDPPAIGAALFELGLVPDFEWLTDPERAPARLNRNLECMRSITWSTRTERARALELGLDDAAFCKRLGDYFAVASVAMEVLVAHVLASLPARETNPRNDDGTPFYCDGAGMSDEDAQTAGEIWYEIAAGECCQESA